MRTLYEVLCELDDGGEPTYEELLHSVRTLDALSLEDRRALGKLADREIKNGTPAFSNSAQYHYGESICRRQQAMGKLVPSTKETS